VAVETTHGDATPSPKVGRRVGARRNAASSPIKTRGRQAGHHRSENRGAALLILPYVLVMIVAGIAPVIYAVEQSLLDQNGAFAGVQSYNTVVHYYDFLNTFKHIGSVIIIWLPIMMVGVVAMALLVHATPGRLGGFMRFVYYLPGALAGVANFMLWLFILDPSVSPFRGLLHAMGYSTLNQTLTPNNLPPVLALMLFFQGAGTWLVILYGGLNGISEDIIEAARLDGANGFQIAMRVKVPIIRPWIGYMALMNLAYGFQLFLEPNVLGTAAHGVISNEWTPNELSYYFAFGGAVGGEPAAAAMSVILLIITLGIGMVIVTKSGLFNKETS
jgi:ABC-type sugar transport system permease subunit